MFKIQPFRICNTKTKERVDLLNFSPINLTDQELIEIMSMLKIYLADFRGKVAEIELEFAERLKKRNAHKYEDAKTCIEVKRTIEYDYNPDVLEELRSLITKDQFDKVFTKYYLVNRKALKNLVALGGEVAAIIDRATIKKEYKPTIKIESKGV
jgi:hypothetical protein